MHFEFRSAVAAQTADIALATRLSFTLYASRLLPAPLVAYNAFELKKATLSIDLSTE